MDSIRIFKRVQDHIHFGSRGSLSHYGQTQFSNYKSRGSSSGFITLSTLLITCLLVISSLGVFQLVQLIHTTKAPKHICRVELLQAQKEVGKKIAQLIKLNPPVQALRLEEKAAKTALIAALVAANPPAITAAKTWLRSVQIRKKLILAQQKSILLTSQVSLQSAIFQTRRKISQELEFRKKQLAVLWVLNPGLISTPLAKISVAPDYAGSDLPTYQTVDNFTQAQALHISWSFDLQFKSEEFQKWTLKKISKKDFCTVSLNKAEENFQAILIGDRRLLNP